ncbi:hypothetical protein PAHAL_9G046900 [Panicum hallii]|uniref:Uncharacterized protein n=1 Tax=Panicum hallii TaxID=206008 RepID=A0A2T8I044_9POAL|nr:hypothetical protein PAHAL_9G046900 [Panicum hallii]
MGSKFKDSSSNQELAGSFILDHAGDGEEPGCGQRRSAIATSTGCSCNELMCIFIFVHGYPVRGLSVRLLHQ